MNGCSRRRDSGKWILYYTLSFIAIAIPVFVFFVYSGKSFVWLNDGAKQVYGTLRYISEIFQDFFHTGHFSFKMVSFELGQGLDALACMCFYGLTDPLNYIAAFFPENCTEALYGLIIALRLYLTGIAFGVYIRYSMKTDHAATAAAVLLYVFCGYLVHTAIKHPHFINGALFLPLMLYGAEKVFREDKPWMFIAMSALGIIVNFFFAYINTIVTIIYIIICLAIRIRKNNVRKCAAHGFMLLGGYLLAAAISAVILLPMAKSYMANGRMGSTVGYHGSLIRYSLTYYTKLFASTCAPGVNAGSWMYVSFSPLAIIACASSLFRKDAGKDRIRNLLLLVILAFFALIPMAGKAFNAFAYVTNRWSYALALPVCAAAAYELPRLMNSGKRRCVITAVFCVLYAAACCILSRRLNARFQIFAGSAILIAFAAYIVISQHFHPFKKLMIPAVAAAIIIGYIVCLIPAGENFIAQFNDLGLHDRLANDVISTAADIDDGEFHRST